MTAALVLVTGEESVASPATTKRVIAEDEVAHADLKSKPQVPEASAIFEAKARPAIEPDAEAPQFTSAVKKIDDADAADIPTADDPRWAGGPHRAPPVAVRAPSNEARPAADHGTLTALALLPQAAKTSAIIEEPSAAAPDEPSAADEVGAKVQRPMPEVAPVPEPERATNEENVPAASQRAKVTTDVKMRSAPRNGAGVVRVVPAGATVGLVDCKAWCRVVYDGKSGYVFKRFVRRQQAEQPQPAAVAAKTDEEAKAETTANAQEVGNGFPGGKRGDQYSR